MKQNCRCCDLEYDSEGHDNSEWLTFCHECNKRLLPIEKEKISHETN